MQGFAAAAHPVFETGQLYPRLMIVAGGIVCRIHQGHDDILDQRQLGANTAALKITLQQHFFDLDDLFRNLVQRVVWHGRDFTGISPCSQARGAGI